MSLNKESIIEIIKKIGSKMSQEEDQKAHKDVQYNSNKTYHNYFNHGGNIILRIWSCFKSRISKGDENNIECIPQTIIKCNHQDMSCLHPLISYCNGRRINHLWQFLNLINKEIMVRRFLKYAQQFILSRKILNSKAFLNYTF